jgi:hypothetical protein
MTYPLTITLDEGPNGLVIAKTKTVAAGAASPGEAVDTLVSLVEVNEVGPLTAPEPRREIIFTMHPTSPKAPKVGIRNVRDVLQDAYDNGSLVYIRGYHVDGTEMDPRVIDIEYIDGNLLGGHDHLKEGFRNFRIDKLVEANDDEAFCRGFLRSL